MKKQHPPFQLVTIPDAQGIYVRVIGRFVLGRSTVAGTWASVEAASRGRTLTLDLCGVSRLDAAGIGRLAELKRRALQHGGDVRLVAAPRRIRRLLQVSGVAPLLLSGRQGERDIVPCEPLPAGYYQRRQAACAVEFERRRVHHTAA